MIRIVNGTYGFWNGKSVVPKTVKDGPFCLSPEQEKRLVDNGVAEYSGQPGEENSEPASADRPLNMDGILSTDMKLADLKEIAAGLGVNASSFRSKAEVISAIEAARHEEGDGEEPPELNATPPVR